MNDSPPIVLYPFRKRDPLTGRWYRARWKASLQEIEAHAGEWRVDGAPVVYRSLGSTGGFQATRRTPVAGHLDMHPQRASPPAIDAAERFLACLFLRRYVRYATRRARHAQAGGAALLWRELRADRAV